MPELLRPRLLERLDGNLPFIVVDGHMGNGKRTLLRQWVGAVEDDEELRVLVDLDRKALDGAEVTRRLLAALDAAGLPLEPADVVTHPDRAVVTALKGAGRPVRLAFAGVDLIDSPASISLLRDWQVRGSTTRTVLSTEDSTDRSRLWPPPASPIK